MDDETDLGPCCRCGGEGTPARTIIMLPYKAPVPGTGWGCAQCGRPQHGALAVVCDVCAAHLEAQRWQPTVPLTELRTL